MMLAHDGGSAEPPAPDGLLREQMVALLEKHGRIHSPAVAAAMRAVGRHHFVPEVPLARAYADDAIVTKWDADKLAISSASQPAMIAIMLEQLAVLPGMRVLEIGTGTGYNAALLAHLVGPEGHVTTVDIDAEIVQSARAHLLDDGYGPDRVTAEEGDGCNGWAAGAPYDRIILTVGAWDVAAAWFDQLAEGGRLVLPLALRTLQVSIAFDRDGGVLRSASLRPCGFIRLRGPFAGPEVLVSLDGPTGLRMLAEPPVPSTEQLARLLTRHPRSHALTPTEGDGMRYWLAITEPRVVSVFAHPAHRALGGQAFGIVTPEGDSACFIAVHGQQHISLHRVEYGAATAALMMETAAMRWAAHGRPTIDDWSLTLHPHSEAAPATTAAFWLPKAQWMIEAQLRQQ